MMIPVKNTSDKDVTIWDGHTPYHIGPGCVEECPENAYKLAIKHSDYKGKIEATDEAATGFLEPPVEKKEDEDPPENPWDADDWDPMSSVMQELLDYSKHSGLTIADGTSLEDLQEIVIEHRMTS